MRIPLITALLFCSTALAQVFDCAESFDYSLSHRSLSSWTDGDLHVTAMAVSARYGVRRRTSIGSFQQREVAVLGESYEVKDAAGESWVMTIHHADAGGLRVLLSRVTGRPLPPHLRFRLAEVTANGARAEVAFGDLELLADGTYALDGRRGAYESGNDEIALDGGHAYWGKGRLSADRHALTFSYRRGPIQWEVKYARVTPDDAALSASR